jgi:hypothetical protein
MKKLIPVGFYRELTDDPAESQTLPRITDALSMSPQGSEEKIVAYLRNGVCVGARGGFVQDVLDPSSSVPLHAHLYTDGKYLWALDIAHYVEKYHLRLPSDFIAHMASRNWKPPTREQVDVRSLEI